MSKKKMFFSKSIEFLTGLVGYYPLNSNANDFSGKGYNGTQVGTLTYESGKVGNAINFGNNDNLNYIDIADNNDFSFTNGTTDVPFTISLWVKFFSFSIVGNWFLSKRNTITGGDEWQLAFAESRVTFAKFQFNSSAYQMIRSSLNPFLLNTWYHLCYTDNGSGAVGSGKLYINGVLDTNINQNVGGTYTRMNNGTSITRIGRNSWNIDDNRLKHRGLIDELAIWKNRELTATEVLELYNKGNAGNPII